MSLTIPDHFSTQFDDNFKAAVQQTTSRFRTAAKVTTGCTGEAKTHNLTLPLDDNETTGERYGKTVLRDLATDKRWNRPRTFDNTTAEPKWDEILLAPTIMPNGSHIMAHKAAYSRRMDKVFIEGAFGTNYVGKEGVTPAQVPTDNIIGLDYTAPGNSPANSSLIIDKIIHGKKILTNNESYGDDQRAAGITLWGAMTPEMEEYLLFLANASDGAAANRLFSKDYMAPQLDENGNISKFLGVNWIRSSHLLRDESDSTIQYAGIWTSDAVHLDIWQDIQTSVDIRPDMKNAVQFFSDYGFNACRSEDKKLVKIACLVDSL